MFWQSRSSSSVTQPRREMPIVIVRTSSFWWSIMFRVSRISEVLIMCMKGSSFKCSDGI